MNVVGVLAVIVLGALYALLVLLVGLRIPRNQLSEFELERRKEQGDPQAVFGAKRQAAYSAIVALRWIKSLIVGLLATIMAYHLFGFGGGVLVVLVGLLLLGPFARLHFVRRLAQRIYRKYELHIIQLVTRTRTVWQFLAPPQEQLAGTSLPTSREEFTHIIKSSNTVISHEEATLLEHALQFYGRDAGEIMTSVDDFVSVPAGEVLGPLVVDGLHKSGHTLFPVKTAGGEYIGVLDISGFASLHRHDSPLARDVMHGEVMHVRRDEPLDEVLKLFVDTKQVCLFVIDDDAAIFGLISLSDIVRALTGWHRRH